MKQRSVLLYSGGIDSTTLLYELHLNGDEVLPLGIDYGQRHIKELQAAESICSGLHLTYRILDLTNARDFLSQSCLTSDAEVPNGHYQEENMKLTVVPNRNMILLALAVGYAINNDAARVAYAAHSGDHAVYPDCRPSFANALQSAVKECHWQPPELYFPFINIDKSQIVSRGAKYKIPFELTWSCYNGRRVHCGKCGTCVERREAFERADIIDRTEYEQ